MPVTANARCTEMVLDRWKAHGREAAQPSLGYTAGHGMHLEKGWAASLFCGQR